tara:strand:+ start:3730 stop:4203 length:474 start_codon:yes stop_codon:yes gene_type:complete
MSDKKPRPLPLVETLVFDIVNYMLDNEGYGYSTDIAQEMLTLKPKRYTSREVIGILRNRPMFRHAQSKERRGGIRWRLDVLSLKRYLIQKGYEDRADARNLYAKIRNLKWRQMMNTLHGLNDLINQLSQLKSDDDAETIVSEETLDTCYEHLANIWS